MPHQCVRCKKICPVGSREIIDGCNNCKGRFFFYIRDDQVARMQENPIEITKSEADNIERDVREIAQIDEETPVILDVESVKVMGDGKFELDLVNLLDKKRPLVYKLEEGKYIIDISSTLKNFQDEKKRRSKKR